MATRSDEGEQERVLSEAAVDQIVHALYYLRAVRLLTPRELADRWQVSIG